jgi:hypothetical protein
VSLISCGGLALISEMCGWQCRGKCCGSGCPPCLLEGWISSLCNVCFLAFWLVYPLKGSVVSTSRLLSPGGF